MRNHLLVVRAGDQSLHPRWLGNGVARSFDLLVSYYGAEPGRYRDSSDLYHAMPGPRWPAHHAICSQNADLLARYRRVGFACDDLDAVPDTWNRLFGACEWFELDLAQPAVQGHTSWPITRPQRGSLLRYTNYVETMCPVFSPRALERVRGTFGESISGWGLDLLWSRALPYPEYKLAVIDQVRVRHTSRIREGSLRPTLDALGIDPNEEMARLAARHRIDRFSMVEYSTLPLAADEEGAA